MTTKTILFASLIAAMIFPFSAMDMAEGMTTTNAEKRIHQETMINQLGNQFGEKYLKWVDEDNSKAKKSLKKQMNRLVTQLEEHGVTYTERWEQNKVYWTEKSGKYVGGDENIESIGDNLLPIANAVADLYFYTGYAHDCWWILTCHKWNDSGVQLGENESGTRDKTLEDDYARSEGEYKVTGSGLAVNFNFVSNLKDGTTVKQDISDSDYLIFFTATEHYGLVGTEYSNLEDGWHYNIQYSVSNIISLLFYLS